MESTFQDHYDYENTERELNMKIRSPFTCFSLFFSYVIIFNHNLLLMVKNSQILLDINRSVTQNFIQNAKCQCLYFLNSRMHLQIASACHRI